MSKTRYSFGSKNSLIGWNIGHLLAYLRTPADLSIDDFAPVYHQILVTAALRPPLPFAVTRQLMDKMDIGLRGFHA